MAVVVTSICRVVIGRFQQARSRPRLIFSRSKGTREPSFLMTLIVVSSVRSYVVNRRLQLTHGRRRRIARPSWLDRESITRSLSMRQKGHFISALLYLPARPRTEAENSGSLGLEMQPFAQAYPRPTMEALWSRSEFL